MPQQRRPRHRRTGVSGSVRGVESLLLFARSPVAGAERSRLDALRGEADAQALASAFLRDIADTCGLWREQRLGADLNRRVVVMAEPDANSPLLAEAARRAGARVEAVRGAEGAEQLRHAFDMEFAHGARSVCAVGASTPTLPAHLLDEAFRALVWERAVLGPTFAGGLWLLGAQRPAPDVFASASWATPAALTQTLDRARAAGVEPHLLPFWYDVGQAADLERIAWHARSLRARRAGAVPETWRVLDELGLAGREGGA